MKKIYNYILPVLFTVFAASCDGDDEEVIRMQNQDPVSYTHLTLPTN